jgi:hypothetical protein
VAEHFLNGSEVCASLEQVSGEGMPEDVRVHAGRVEARRLGQPAEDQERARTRERPAFGVQEELRPVPPVEVGAAAGEVTAHRVGRVAADRHDPLLAALAGHPHEPVVEIDAALVQPDRFRDAETGAVHQLDERLVA